MVVGSMDGKMLVGSKSHPEASPCPGCPGTSFHIIGACWGWNSGIPPMEAPGRGKSATTGLKSRQLTNDDLPRSNDRRQLTSLSNLGRVAPAFSQLRNINKLTSPDGTNVPFLQSTRVGPSGLGSWDPCTLFSSFGFLQIACLTYGGCHGIFDIKFSKDYQESDFPRHIASLGRYCTGKESLAQGSENSR